MLVYLSPLSQSIVKTIPSGLFFSTQRSDAKILAPAEIPTNNPFSKPSFLHLFYASSVDIGIISSILSRSTKNLDPSPIPCIP